MKTLIITLVLIFSNFSYGFEAELKKEIVKTVGVEPPTIPALALKYRADAHNTQMYRTSWDYMSWAANTKVEDRKKLLKEWEEKCDRMYKNEINPKVCSDYGALTWYHAKQLMDSLVKESKEKPELKQKNMERSQKEVLPEVLKAFAGFDKACRLGYFKGCYNELQLNITIGIRDVAKESYVFRYYDSLSYDQKDLPFAKYIAAVKARVHNTKNLKEFKFWLIH